MPNIMWFQAFLVNTNEFQTFIDGTQIDKVWVDVGVMAMNMWLGTHQSPRTGASPLDAV